ncbi:hypothetical protein HELRODRAFT_175565 [Helobdella robusta]|uniref:FH2 domain-containing protein n=1 Tax=Helobdella robusta TaxID=6412 RepID=T1F9D7_HELRO|nr:hypothetical protein HELRODRAFT_175565 [Helobdella robusta]ESO00596.1 hypothetical protein HELRODRAFT_175565 [Helobdella robusta]
MVLDIEILKSLVRIFPDDRERTTLKEYKGDVERLGSAEHFLLSIINFPCFHQTTQAMLSYLELHQLLETARPAIEAIINCSKAIKESRAFHEVVYTVLMVGNFLNTEIQSMDPTVINQIEALRMHTSSSLHNVPCLFSDLKKFKSNFDATVDALLVGGLAFPETKKQLSQCGKQRFQ